MTTIFNISKITKKKYFLLFGIILFLCIFFFIKNKWFSESFITEFDTENINNILSIQNISYFEKISKIKELNEKDIKDDDLETIIKKNLKIMETTLHSYTNSDKTSLSKKNKEEINGIISTPHISSYKKIYNIKLLNISESRFNDIISNSESVIIDSIKKYVNIKI